ncbi:MAG: FkbM family methyltransferase [Acetatifactor sp.]|nr:FkbM family methyltransferase [Acetatifactor sp.]
MRKELIHLESILKSLQKVSAIFQQSQGVDDGLICELLNTIEEVNTKFFGCRRLPAFPFDEHPDNAVSFGEEYRQWLDTLSDELEYRKSLLNKIDYDFYILLSHVSVVSEEALVAEGVACLENIRRINREGYEDIKRVYNAYSHFWGSLDLENGDTDLIKDRVHEIKSHLEDFCWLYNNLADYRSKKVLYGILRFWLTFDYEYKNSIKENNYDDYYDFDIINCGPEECLVDLGAYTGDSALSFIQNFGAYKRIYCYEMTAASMEKMQKNLQDFDNIIYRQVAVGNRNGSIYITGVVGDLSSNIVDSKGNTEIPMVKLDDDISEPITFIKMDIEGSEVEAMRGAERHIREDKPKLAICSYHNNHHIYEIPKLMREYNPEYKLYMRYNGPLDNILISEFVTFAIP